MRGVSEEAKHEPAGRLITIEGLDGAGKSTLACALASALSARGEKVELLREPGGVPVSERIRDLLCDPELAIAPRAETLLYAAARAQLVAQRLLPALRAGSTVLLDRFLDSSLAYQGAGRGLGMEQVRQLNMFATGGLTPELTLLLRISPQAGRERLDGRGHAPDRLEREQSRFFDAVAAAYEQIAASEPSRVRTIDAAKPADQVLAEALAAIDALTPSG